MDFLELSNVRYSVRNYTDQPVEEEKLQKILEAGRLAPTAGNRQPQKIYVLKSEEALSKIRSAASMAKNAPVVMMVCYDETKAWRNRLETFGDTYCTGEMDASISCTAMMMEATELGLGTLWVRGYSTEKILQEFPLPEHIKLVCLLLVGYAADDQDPNNKWHLSRKPMSEMVTEL